MPFTIEEKAWHYVQEIQWSIRIDPLVNKIRAWECESLFDPTKCNKFPAMF